MQRRIDHHWGNMKAQTYIQTVPFVDTSIEELETQISSSSHSGELEKYIFDYPAVYVIEHGKSGKFSVYIGETNDIRSRTKQHLDTTQYTADNWHLKIRETDAKLHVIGNTLFNKSLTLDVENRLMSWLLGTPHISKLYNGRSNPQRNYYTQEQFDEVFHQIWRELRKENSDLFPVESVIRDSALFKASPFHKLTDEQVNAKREIYESVLDALDSDKTGQLILVSGEAGSGKTVLLSNLFYELSQLRLHDDETELGLSDVGAAAEVFMLINHDEQLVVYQQIAQKLGLGSTVSKPTRFINNRTANDKVDVILVDEAHLLWTQGKQSYRGKNQLADLLERARVVIAVYDDKQILASNQYADSIYGEWLNRVSSKRIHLENQMRMDAPLEVVNWIRSIIDDGIVKSCPANTGKYEIKIFDSPQQLHDAIAEKATSVEHGLSRLLATYDWEYNAGKCPEDISTWNVKIGDWSMPWNREIKRTTKAAEGRELSKRNKGLAWAEQEQTIDEVGSIFTIQGFDLNYAGVILGESVKYRDGHIVFDVEASCNTNAKKRRTMSDRSKRSVAEELLRNELNVLLTRGVNGLYIYAIDDDLRKALHMATQTSVQE